MGLDGHWGIVGIRIFGIRGFAGWGRSESRMPAGFIVGVTSRYTDNRARKANHMN